METGYYISQKDYNTIINYAQAAYSNMKCEIGGMSICYQDQDGDWVVTDPVIIKQEVTGGTCDLDKEALANYYCKAAKKHEKKNFRFCWWHSHHTMEVFWSGTDIKGINEYSGGDLSFALVVNLKRENKFRISMWNPVVMHEDVTLQILHQNKVSVPKKILKEVEELCKKPSYVWKNKGTAYTPKKQSNLWDDNVYDYNYGYNYGSYAESRINHGAKVLKPADGQMFSYCHGKIIDWIDELGAGRLTYETYKREVDDANDELVKMKSPCMFVLISKSELDEDLEWSDPSMWIRAVSYKEDEQQDLIEERTNGVIAK